jgi:putative N6-adenine-specific DNA methylase
VAARKQVLYLIHDPSFKEKGSHLDSYFAVTAPGLEPFTAQELSSLFPQPEPLPVGRDPEAMQPGSSNPAIAPAATVLAPSPGGIEFRGGLPALYAANLHLRTASRILARLGNFFHATTFPQLEERLTHLPWERFLVPGQPISLRVTCHTSKLYHSGAVRRTVASALKEHLGVASPILPADLDSTQPPQLIVVRLADDICTVSADSSGRLLHKRGYRQAVAKAPLRETLAAALLMASGWDRASPLLDPFCGSGTIPIEASLMALGIPPGIHRRFAFMNWPGFDDQLWNSILTEVSPRRLNHPVLQASDRDAGAIRMAQANAERAGVLEGINFKCQAVSSILPPADAGWIVTNPPYGLRVSQGKDLRDLYAQFGNVIQQKCPGWTLAVLCSDPVLLGQVQIRLDTSLSFVNGGLRVRLGRGKVGK